MGQQIRGQMNAHGNIHRSDNCLRLVQGGKQAEHLATAGATWGQNRLRIIGMSAVICAERQHAQLVGRDKEGHCLQILGHILADGADQDVTVDGMAHWTGVEPCLCKRARFPQPFLVRQEIHHYLPAREAAGAGQPVSAAWATLTRAIDHQGLAPLPILVMVKNASPQPHQRREQLRIGCIVNSNRTGANPSLRAE
jgi:hypothetical protein